MLRRLDHWDSRAEQLMSLLAHGIVGKLLQEPTVRLETDKRDLCQDFSDRACPVEAPRHRRDPRRARNAGPFRQETRTDSRRAVAVVGSAGSLMRAPRLTTQ